MTDDRVQYTHRASPEFWTIVGTLVAMGALILTVTGWLREDIRDVSAGLKALEGQVNALAVGFEALEVKVDMLDKRVEKIERRVETIERRVETIERRVETMDSRLAVVERHVLGIASVDRNEEGA